MGGQEQIGRDGMERKKEKREKKGQSGRKTHKHTHREREHSRKKGNIMTQTQNHTPCSRKMLHKPFTNEVTQVHILACVLESVSARAPMTNCAKVGRFSRQRSAAPKQKQIVSNTSRKRNCLKEFATREHLKTWKAFSQTCKQAIH